MPDEAFRRLHGALFFGPAFRVTRNKLLFRDNLAEVLATAVPGGRLGGLVLLCLEGGGSNDTNAAASSCLQAAQVTGVGCQTTAPAPPPELSPHCWGT